MGNYGSTLLGDKHDTKLALKMSRLAYYQQLLERAKSKAETESSFFAEAHDDEPHSKSSEDPADYDFEFENLVLEGGGAKGIAYCGAIKYLEQIGLMKNIKGLAGASAGALVALMLAVGYTSKEIKKFNKMLNEILFGGDLCHFGYIYSIVKALISNYGVHPGKRLYEELGEKIKEKGFCPDITFQELLDEKKIKLCIVVTNLSEKSTLYCHPKTTPDMPIRLAARMSMSYPGLFSPIKTSLYTKDHDWFVDGGLLCNYPIHCFDGWFLSMKKKDAFINRIKSLEDIPNMMDHKNCFKEVNHKTLGIMVNADSDDDVLKWRLDERSGCKKPDRPTHLTSLYKKRAKTHVAHEIKEQCKNIKRAADNFIKAVTDRHNSKKDTISLEELEEIIKDEKVFPKEDAECLFGKDVTPREAFKKLDEDKHGKISFYDLMRFLYESGILLQEYFYGNERTEITGLTSYAETIISSLMLGTEKAVVHESDIDRTVGINTGYVGTMDFKLEHADLKFLVKRGYNGTHAFFQEYIANHRDKVRKKEKTT